MKTVSIMVFTNNMENVWRIFYEHIFLHNLFPQKNCFMTLGNLLKTTVVTQAQQKGFGG